MLSSDSTVRKEILFSVYIKQAFIGLGSCYVMYMKEANGTFLIIIDASIFVLNYFMCAFEMILKLCLQIFDLYVIFYLIENVISKLNHENRIRGPGM